jgi:two-component system, LytTR family, sensor histidine kinase AlgZ
MSQDSKLPTKNRPKISKPGHVAFWGGWLFFTLILAALLDSGGELTWLHAFGLAALLSGTAQVSAWTAIFTCKTTPLLKTPIWRLILVHLVASLVLSFFWIKIGSIYAQQIDTLHGWGGIRALYESKIPLLYAIGIFYYLLSVVLNYALIAQEQNRLAQQRILESDVRARDAELNALKAQINPHFLYNSLNSISALTSIDPARAREMCVLLADFLRCTLGVGEKTVISLQEELALLEKYCAIEKIRFGNRLTLEEEIQDDARACLLPPLLLQPLVENAVVHGIAQLPEGGHIRLRAVRNRERLALTVENTWDPEAHSTRRNGVGLKNVQRRLETRYGKDAHLQANAEDDMFRVVLALPAQTAEAQ